MRIGLFVGSVGSGATLDDQVQQVVDAENDGFDSFWAPQVMTIDVMTLFALAGQRTNRIHMGTAVSPIFIRHPMAMAQQSLTTNAATNGRFNLGIGLSHRNRVEGMFGLTYDKPALRMREYLTILNSLITNGEAAFDGEMYSVNVSISVPSASSFPVLVAALGSRMLGVAGELADGTIPWMAGPRTLSTHIVPKVRKAAESAGRPSPRVCAALPIAVTDDKSAAFEKAAQVYNHYNDYPNFKRLLDIEGVESAAEVAIVGSESEVERQLRAIANTGATEFLASIFPVGDDADASVARTRELLMSLVGKV